MKKIRMTIGLFAVISIAASGWLVGGSEGDRLVIGVYDSCLTNSMESVSNQSFTGRLDLRNTVLTGHQAKVRTSQNYNILTLMTDVLRGYRMVTITNYVTVTNEVSPTILYQFTTSNPWYVITPCSTSMEMAK